MSPALSLYLDIVRPLAALIVLLSHISYNNLSDGQMEFMGSAGVQAVDAFFVLSGFVIAHVCATREKDAHSYFVSRAVRIYSVALPALILVPFIDAIGLRLDTATYEGPYQPYTLGVIVRSVLFLGEMWDTHRFPGSDGPYWSLGFEVWFYIIFGLFFFLRGTWKWVAPALALVVIGPKVALMFPAWLIGVAAYRYSTKQRHCETTGWFLFITSFVLLTLYQFIPHSPLQAFVNFSFSPQRLQTLAQDYFLAAVFGMNIIGFSIVSTKFERNLTRCSKIIRWVAGATFSLYLMHLPIMHFLAALSPWPKSSPWTLALLLIGAPAGCMLYAGIFERRKDVWKRFFVSLSNAPATVLALRGVPQKI